MFLIAGDGRILDLDLQFLQDLLELLDDRLRRLEEEAGRVPDPDAFGIFDSAEYIIGLGFVACQGYLASTYGDLKITKSEALKVGPMHRSGYSIATLVNHAANFWKHHEEWALSPASAAQERTLLALAALLETDAPTSYPLSRALAALVSPTPSRLRPLLPHLEAWRDTLASAA